jgi:flagellar motility protein MotE (MotC chaperone)
MEGDFMRSVILFSFLSFIVIFAGTFLVTGVFQGLKTAYEGNDEEAAGAAGADSLSLERQSLQARAADLTRRESEIEDLQESLELERAVLSEEFNKLSGLRAGIDQAAGEVEVERVRSLKKLAKVYEAMPPKDAAAILSGMDVDIVLEVLRNMKERPAAQVLASLDPGRAAALSNMLSAQKEN